MNAENIIIDKYELIEKIGEGGFGIVYKAKNQLFNKIVAVKIIKGASQEELKSYLREIRIMDKLNPPHLNVIRLISADIINDILLIEMEYFEGRTLQKLIDNNTLDDEKIVEYAKQILDGLSYIHSKRLVHRDIKPDNILLNKDESLIKVSDFGISKDRDRDYTSSNSIQGAFLYMSPEQLSSPDKVDHRSDFYSLAIVLYQLKTGLIPFNGSITNIIDGKRYKTIPKTKSFLDSIIQKASRIKPNERFNSAEEFRLELNMAYEKSKNKKRKLIIWSVVILISALMLFKLIQFMNVKKVELVETEEVSNNKQLLETLLIGNQTWHQNNLNTTQFRNGTSIIEATTEEEWIEACSKKLPAYCHVDNDEKNDKNFGLLYNWYAVNSDNQLAPEGFKIPSLKDWEILFEIYGGKSNCGELLKSNKYWKTRKEMINKNSLNIIPSGWKDEVGKKHNFKGLGVYWTSTERYEGCIEVIIISDNSEVIKIDGHKPNDAYSVRCVLK
jgi:uncharacterized protein (TIGR02145 family)